jgi:hypothetical protein
MNLDNFIDVDSKYNSRCPASMQADVGRTQYRIEKRLIRKNEHSFVPSILREKKLNYVQILLLRV